jgi:signal transduction histidine kinase
MVTVVTWIVRWGALLAVALTTLRAQPQHRALVVVSLACLTILLIGWLLIDTAPRFGWRPPPWAVAAILGGVAAVGGLITDIRGVHGAVAFTLIACIAAGNDLRIGPAFAVTAIAVLAIEISALLFGFSTVTDLGDPLLVIGGLLVGRNRRDARVRQIQGAALAEQAELTRAEQRRSATLEERNRMAREIHDLLAHTLGALGIQLEAVQAVLTDTGDVDYAARLIERARGLAGTGLMETRHAILALRADTPPLPQSLAALAERYERDHRQAIQVNVTGNPRPVAPEANLALIRTAGEALDNATKYADASPITVDLDYRSTQVTMIISNSISLPRDDGDVDPDQERDRYGGYGLAGMHERLLLIGGTLTAGSTGGKWIVQARVPA